MMTRVSGLLIGILLLLASGLHADDRRVYVQYHLWYAEGDVPLPWTGMSTYWNGWSQIHWGVANGVHPDVMRTPWRRATASRTGLPLLGPYSSVSTADQPALAYSFRVAKQAGIDGMFASVFDDAWYPIFDTHLGLAAAAGMPLGLELYHTNWGPVCSETATQQFGRRVTALKNALAHAAHANYLRIDGKPVVWIANAPACESAGLGKVFTWGNRAQLAQIIDEVKAQTGLQFSLVMSGPTLDNVNAAFSDIPDVLRVVGAENISVFWGLYGYANQTFTPRTPADRPTFEAAYQGSIDFLRSHAPGKAGLHVYPAFDERGLFPTSLDRGSGLTVPRNVIGRDGNGMYDAADGFLNAALDKAASNQIWVFLESWNDWVEQTQLEPGFHSDQFLRHKDFFSAVRRIAAWKGMSDVGFELPAATLLDPPLRTQCRHKQWGSLTSMRAPSTTVRLRGKFGFQTGAQLSNGISLGLFMYRDGVWEATSIPKSYDGTLKSFDFDITNAIDAQAVIFGIDGLGNSSWDWAYLTELVLDWYGQPIDLLQESILSQFFWHSSRGTVVWTDGDPNHGPSGVARLSPVTMENGVSYPKALYLVPDYDPTGFIHGGVNFPATGAPRRVVLTGRFGFANGAAGTNGAALGVWNLEDDRSYQSPSHSPASHWDAQILYKPYDGKLKRFAIDITALLDKPAIAIGVEDAGNSYNDWVHFTELKLNWYGQTIDLINSGAASQLAWNSQHDTVIWNDPDPSNGSHGVARVSPSTTMEDGVTYTNTLFLHPDYDTNGFIHTGLNSWILSQYITPCP